MRNENERIKMNRHLKNLRVIQYVCLIILMSSGEVFSYGNLSATRRLFHDLLDDYDNDVRPTENLDNITRVEFEVFLRSIQDINEIDQTFKFSAGFALYWNDSSMIWNPLDYNGIWHVEVSFDRVWTPNFVLVSPSKETDSIGKPWQKIRYTYDGYAIWFTAGLIQSTCDVNSRNYPFDSHLCTAEFIIWGYTVDEIDFILDNTKVDDSYFKKSSVWDLVDSSVTVSVLNYLEWPQVAVTLHLSRRAGFVITNVLGPVFILDVLNLLVFLLVPESGERLSYCLTVLLSITVFLTIVNDNLPKNSDPLPLISYKLMVDLASSALITAATIFDMKIYHRNEDKDIPKWVRMLYRVFSHKSFGRNKVAMNGRPMSVSSAQDMGSRHSSIKQISELDLDVDKLPEIKTALKWVENEDTNISWKDISRMLDHFFLFVFSAVFLTSSLVYIILVTSKNEVELT